MNGLETTDNLYTILGINCNAKIEEIKKAYRRLALKYHPDKSKTDTNEKFNHITIAYDILSNPESRQKYDSLNNTQHNNLLSVIMNFVKSMVNPDNINKLVNIICENDSSTFNEFNNMNTPDYKKLKTQIEERLQNKIDLEYINDFMHELLVNDIKLNKVDLKEADLSIFMKQENIPEKKYQLIDTVQVDKSIYSQEIGDTQSSSNEMNIYGEIKTILDEVYSGYMKEITVKRQLLENNKIVFKQFKYNVPLLNDNITFKNQGDEYLDQDNNIKVGDLIINVRCKKHKYFKRVNDFDILVSLPLTLFELFNGFNKQFDYFNDQPIKLAMTAGYDKIKSNMNISSQSKFDGQKMIVTLNNVGLINDKGGRGNLIIYLVLIKKDNFNEILKKYFE